MSKTIEPLEEDIPLAERENILYKGTALTRGSGEGIVVATGMKTELGNISELAEEAGDEEKTPLEKRLDQLGRKLVWLTIAVAAVLAIAGIIVGKDLKLMVEVAIALAVAAVPEGLPIVATVALARGMWRMAKRNALINQLSAVETLGATSVICTDKTGTLTENQMTMSHLVLDSGQIEISGDALETEGEFKRDEQKLKPQEDKLLKAILEVGVLCNNASLQPRDSNESRVVGDPMEVALLVAGAKADLQREQLLEQMPEVREEAFDPDLKMMATYHEVEGKYRVAVKGAPEAVFEVCSSILTDSEVKSLTEEDKEDWREQANQLAAKGLRILALAQKTVDSQEAEAYEDLTFLGVVGLLDPPRDSQEAILTRRHWLAIAGYGVVIAVALLAAFALAFQWLSMDKNQAVTVSFITLGFTRLWHVFNMRDNDSGIFKNEITRNPYIWGALLFCTGLLLIAVYVPFLSQALQTVDPGVNGWLLIIGMSLVPLVVGQVFKLFRK